MVDRVVLMGAEDVERAGRSISGAADVMQRAADTFDRSSDFLARCMLEETSRVVAALAEHDAEVTLRDEFAMRAMQGMLATAGAPCLGGLDGYEPHTAAAAYRLADAMLKARASHG